jgi:hypothetical protein
MTRDELSKAIEKNFGQTLDEMTMVELEDLLALVRNEGAIRAILDEIARRERS